MPIIDPSQSIKSTHLYSYKQVIFFLQVSDIHPAATSWSSCGNACHTLLYFQAVQACAFIQSPIVGLKSWQSCGFTLFRFHWLVWCFVLPRGISHAYGHEPTRGLFIEQKKWQSNKLQILHMHARSFFSPLIVTSMSLRAPAVPCVHFSCLSHIHIQDSEVESSHQPASSLSFITAIRVPRLPLLLLSSSL